MMGLKCLSYLCNLNKSGKLSLVLKTSVPIMEVSFITIYLITNQFWDRIKAAFQKYVCQSDLCIGEVVTVQKRWELHHL